jgi:hypothetical protein
MKRAVNSGWFSAEVVADAIANRRIIERRDLSVSVADRTTSPVGAAFGGRSRREITPVGALS